MMRNSLKDKFRLFLYHRIPLLVTVLMMFFFYMPINFFDLHNIRPVVGFICVYYWTIKRRYMFGYVSAFFVGFLMDIYNRPFRHAQWHKSLDFQRNDWQLSLPAYLLTQVRPLAKIR